MHHRTLILAAVLALACVAPAGAQLAPGGNEDGDDPDVVYTTNDAGVSQTDAQYASHEASYPHWKWLFRKKQQDYIKVETTIHPRPTKACTSDNEGERVDVWDPYYKGFTTWRCYCYSSGCQWEMVNRYGTVSSSWFGTPLWESAWPYPGFGKVRDKHRLCTSIVCDQLVWATHSYRRKIG